MRRFLVAAALIAAIFAYPCSAFEIEQEHVFSVDDPQAELKIISTTDLIHFLPLIEAFQRSRPDLALRLRLQVRRFARRLVADAKMAH